MFLMIVELLTLKQLKRSTGYGYAFHRGTIFQNTSALLEVVPLVYVYCYLYLPILKKTRAPHAGANARLQFDLKN